MSPASDFATFRLYRGVSADFVPGSGNLVTATTDTGYVDMGAAAGYYKVSAVDFNSNESGFSVVGPDQTTGVPAAPRVAFALEGTRPNPAIGGRMMVHFALPSGDPATLELIDVTGRCVRQRAVGSFGAGRHAVDLAERSPTSARGPPRAAHAGGKHARHPISGARLDYPGIRLSLGLQTRL